jgi:hypothetical protein
MDLMQIDESAKLGSQDNLLGGGRLGTRHLLRRRGQEERNEIADYCPWSKYS